MKLNSIALAITLGSIYLDYSNQTGTLHGTLRFCKMCHSQKSLPENS